MTASEELEKVNTAITAILTGGVSSYTINGRGVTKLSYDSLVKRKKELEAAVARETSGGFFAAQFRDPE